MACVTEGGKCQHVQGTTPRSLGLQQVEHGCLELSWGRRWKDGRQRAFLILQSCWDGFPKHLNWNFRKSVSWDRAWVQCRISGKWSQETKVRMWTRETGLREKVQVIGWEPTETTAGMPCHCAVRGKGRWGTPDSHLLTVEGWPCGTNIFVFLGRILVQGSRNPLIIEERNRRTRWEAVSLLGPALWLQGNSSDWGKSLLQHTPCFGQWTWAEVIDVTSAWKL